MLLLLIDTSGPRSGALLADIAADSNCDISVWGQAELEPRQASIQIIPAIARMLETNGRVLADVDAFGAVTGPGSFTGLRVGLSTIKAMAEASGKPIIAVSRLAAMASSVEDAGLVHAVVDAGRGEFYHGAYRDRGEVCVSESLQPLSALIEKLQQERGIIVSSEPTVLSALTEFAPRQISGVGAIRALRLAASASRARQFTDVVTLDASYLGRINPTIAAKAIQRG